MKNTGVYVLHALTTAVLAYVIALGNLLDSVQEILDKIRGVDHICMKLLFREELSYAWRALSA